MTLINLILMKRVIQLPSGSSRLSRPVRSLYFIHEKGGTNCKIGYTLDLTTRRNNLQVGNPYKLVVTASKPVKDGRLSELQAHYAFKDSRIRGEWYKISEEEAIDFVNKLT